MDTHKRLRLFATAIALQQMHGREYARIFLIEQGIDGSEARDLVVWAVDFLPRPSNPSFAHEYKRAIAKLLNFREFASLAGPPLITAQRERYQRTVAHMH